MLDTFGDDYSGLAEHCCHQTAIFAERGENENPQIVGLDHHQVINSQTAFASFPCPLPPNPQPQESRSEPLGSW